MAHLEWQHDILCILLHQHLCQLRLALGNLILEDLLPDGELLVITTLLVLCLLVGILLVCNLQHREAALTLQGLEYSGPRLEQSTERDEDGVQSIVAKQFKSLSQE